MNLTALPAFTDDHIWMLDDSHHAVVADPGDSAPVLAALAARQLVLAPILVTHHAGHVGGVDAVPPHLQGPTSGPGANAFPQPFVPLMDGEHVNVPGLRFEMIDVPGHTSRPIAYFAAPVGDTRAGCAHEHTLSNLKLARAMQPANREPAAHTAWCESRRAAGVPTLPSSIARELQANPFLRCAERAPAQRARDRGAPTHDVVAVAVPAALREWKNE